MHRARFLDNAGLGKHGVQVAPAGFRGHFPRHGEKMGEHGLAAGVAGLAGGEQGGAHLLGDGVGAGDGIAQPAVGFVDAPAQIRARRLVSLVQGQDAPVLVIGQVEFVAQPGEFGGRGPEQAPVGLGLEPRGEGEGGKAGDETEKQDPGWTLHRHVSGGVRRRDRWIGRTVPEGWR